MNIIFFSKFIKSGFSIYVDNHNDNKLLQYLQRKAASLLPLVNDVDNIDRGRV